MNLTRTRFLGLSATELDIQKPRAKEPTDSL